MMEEEDYPFDMDAALEEEENMAFEENYNEMEEVNAMLAAATKKQPSRFLPSSKIENYINILE
jgi:hypothetical protein